MARWGRVDYSQLQAFAKAVNKLSASDMDKLCVDCSKALAARLLALVIRETPVGKYDKPVKFTTADGRLVSFTPQVKKKGGTLRRGWTAKTEEDAKSGNSSNAIDYASSLRIRKMGNLYTVEIINPVEYASYVEFGHRTVNGGWAEGKYMLTISEEKLKRVAPGVLEKMVLKKLREVCNV